MQASKRESNSIENKLISKECQLKQESGQREVKTIFALLTTVIRHITNH